MRYWISAAAVLALSGLALKAYAFHGAGTMEAGAGRALAIAIDMQLIEALALLGVTALAERLGRLGPWAAIGLLSGTVLFCGPIYLRAFAGMDGLMALTPIGGGLQMLGWAVLAVAPFLRR